MSDGGANNCTIELAHGGYVHVKHTAAEVAEKIEQARQDSVVWVSIYNPETASEQQVPFPAPPPMIELDRMEGFDMRTARGFPTVHLNITQIAGVFPLTSQSVDRGK